MEQEVNYWNKPGISNSSLSLFNYDVELYYKTYVTKEYKTKESDSTILGSLVHMLLLEEDKFKNTYTILDSRIDSSTKMGIFLKTMLDNEYLCDEEEQYEIAFRKAEYKITKEAVIKDFEKNYFEYYKKLADAKTNNKTIISTEEFNNGLKLKEVVQKNNHLEKIIINKEEWDCYKELELSWSEEINGKIVWLKSKLDELWVKKDGFKAIYVDYKTDSKNTCYEYKKTFDYYKTHRQLAFYQLGILAFIEEKYEKYDPFIESYIISIDVNRFKSMLHCVHHSYITQGHEEIEQDLIDLQWHIDNNLWEYPKRVYEELKQNKNNHLTLIYEE